MYISRISRKIFLVLGVILFFTFMVGIKTAHAASATISVSPHTGTYGTPFTVDVVVDGGGQAFNAAQATVAISSNLTPTNLVLGDCNFSFVSTPSIANPSFAGIILGNSSKRCTVYTVTLTPVAKGDGSVSLSKASVKRYGDAVNILSSLQNGAYTLTAALKDPSSALLPTVLPPKANLYSIVLTITNSDGTPVKTTPVTLKSVAAHTLLRVTTDAKGTAQFSNIEPGIYDATVANYVGEKILNVSGNNHVLVLGIKVAPQRTPLLLKMQDNPLLIAGILALGIIVGVGVAIFFIWLKRSKKTKG